MVRERELCTSPVLPRTAHGTSNKFINLSSVKTPVFCCGQIELPAASSACQSVPTPTLGISLAWKVPLPFFHLTPHLSSFLDFFPALDGR